MHPLTFQNQIHVHIIIGLSKHHWRADWPDIQIADEVYKAQHCCNGQIQLVIVLRE